MSESLIPQYLTKETGEWDAAQMRRRAGLRRAEAGAHRRKASGQLTGRGRRGETGRGGRGTGDSRDSRREDGDGGAGRLTSAAAARDRDGTRARSQEAKPEEPKGSYVE